MTVLRKLVLASAALHSADQIALVAVPILAVLVFDATPQTIGLLVACQSMAHLLGSLPFGMWVDRAELRSLTWIAALFALVGYAGAAVSVYFASLLGFATTVTLAGFGIVLFTLATLSIVPKVLATDQLARSNAQLDLARTVATLVVPLAIAYTLTQQTANGVFAAATLASVCALVVLWSIPRIEATTKTPERWTSQLVAGAIQVSREPLLRAIALCATCWNFAFSALMVTAIPFLGSFYQLEAATFGTAMAAFGVGGVAGSWTMRTYGSRLAPNAVLLFGPASSFAASGILLGGAPFGIGAVILAFFLLGFGPSMWLAAQNTVRQLVSPPAVLGRVNAVIQTAIYGVRPIGAIVAGLMAGAAGPWPGTVCVVAGFGLSFATAVFTGLRTVKRYDTLKPSCTA